MKRSYIQNSSFTACTDCALLTFLAPRVLIETPIPRPNQRYHSGTKSASKEKDDIFAHQRCLNVQKNDVKSHEILGNKTRNSTILRTKCQSPILTLHGAHSSHDGFANSVGTRYANISTFARLYMGRYSASNSTISRVEDRGEPQLPSVVNPDSPSTSYTSDEGYCAHTDNREKMLALGETQLAKYLLYSGHFVKKPFTRGQYRSLRRRIVNLYRWDRTQADLTGLAEINCNVDLHIEAFAALDRRRPSMEQLTNEITILHHHLCPQWYEAVFGRIETLNTRQAWSNWMCLDLKTRKRAFKPLLIYVLDFKPFCAMLFLQVLANDSALHQMSREIIADALDHLAMIHNFESYSTKGDWGANQQALKRNFAPAFVSVYRKALDNSKKLTESRPLADQLGVCSQDLLLNLANITEVEDFQEVFSILIESRAHLNFDTLLHYMNKFAKAGNVRYALRALGKLRAIFKDKAWNVLVDRVRFRKSCALILRMSLGKSKGQGYDHTHDVLRAFSRLGIETDTTFYNIVMHNAMDTFDYATAFKVYNALGANGLTADKYTYSILLRGCSLQNNPRMFSQFAKHCAVVASQIQDHWLATDYMYYLYICHQDYIDKGRTFALIQKAYLRFFPWKPLEFISDQSQVTRDTSNPANLKETPSMALYLVLQSAIQYAAEIGHYKLMDLYQQFKQSAKQDRDTGLAELASKPIIWNAFLLAFCRQNRFADASQVMKDMTEDGPKPNVYSWNIFMQGFFKTGQFEAGDRVFELMQKQGLVPDQFTYGILLRGYAKAQNITGIGQVMLHLNEEEEMDPALLMALSRVLDRNKLMSVLEETRRRKDVAAQEEVRSKVEERWQVPRSQEPGGLT